MMVVVVGGCYLRSLFEPTPGQRSAASLGLMTAYVVVVVTVDCLVGCLFRSRVWHGATRTWLPTGGL